jgi:hypothetical protein
MKPKRQIRKSHLLFGEGSEDKAVFKHLLRTLKVNDSLDFYAYAGGGTGGSPRDIINAAAREIGNFDCRLVVIDRDNKTEKELAEIVKYASKKNVECHILTPCLESIILHIINPMENWKKRSTKDCKHEVESKHVSSKKRTDEYAYKKLSRKKIIEAAKSDPELKFLLDYLKVIE